MRRTKINRREFIKLGIAAGGAGALFNYRDRLPAGEAPPPFGYGRIAWDWLPVRDRPSFNGEQIGRRNLDQVIPLLDEVISEDGPSYNPRWYRIVGGYIFSGYIQRVETHLQRPHREIDTDGMLAEVTVPYTDSLRYTREAGWTFLYRLYYRSTHWVTSIEQGPDGKAWYGITNDRHRQVYFAPAAHLRIITAEEVAPISPDVPEEEKRIEISIDNQTLTAYEYGRVVLETSVATGVPQQGTPDNGIPTDTPFGAFRVSRKMPSRHMGDGDLVSNISNYELPGVPWVCFFVSTGVAIHGAYWHDNFGRRMSHGCVNMRPDDAKWIYRWTTPAGGHDDWYVEFSRDSHPGHLRKIMPNAYGAPEITVSELQKKVQDNKESFILLDVREPYELGYAQLNFEQMQLLPLSRLAREQLKALPENVQPKDAEIIIMCHHGVRSAQVTAWMIQNGWKNVTSLMGGIDAWAREIDPTVGYY